MAAVATTLDRSCHLFIFQHVMPAVTLMTSPWCSPHGSSSNNPASIVSIDFFPTCHARSDPDDLTLVSHLMAAVATTLDRSCHLYFQHVMPAVTPMTSPWCSPHGSSGNNPASIVSIDFFSNMSCPQ
jgi:hypothetical protein